MRIQSQFPWKDHDCNIEKTTIFAKVILSTLSLLFIDTYTTTMPIVAANCKSSKQNHLVSSICPLNKESCQSWGLAAPQHSSWDDDNDNQKDNHNNIKADDDNDNDYDDDSCCIDHDVNLEDKLPHSTRAEMMIIIIMMKIKPVMITREYISKYCWNMILLQCSSHCYCSLIGDRRETSSIVREEFPPKVR